MKITALLLVLIKPHPEGSDPVILANATDVGHLPYWQRFLYESSLKEFIVLVGRTLAKRTKPGQRKTVQHEEYKVHCYNRDGLYCALAFTEDHYPVRSAFCILNDVIDEYQKRSFGGDHFSRQEHCNNDQTASTWPYLNEALNKFQDPCQADKLLKIQWELDETKILLHKTIESVLERGEKLDSLVEKSSDLSAASVLLYKTTKKTNQCCTIM